jgi:serine/threonine-protein kinase HipA
MKPLRILYDGIEVGRAIPDGSRFALEYDEGWRRLEFAFPLSRTLPLRDASFSPEDAHPFFANLLPEGLSRQAICERLGISVDNDVELLRALGDDTAGAFTFVSEGGASQDVPRLRVTKAMLAEWSSGEPPLPEERPLRLSIAGAQYKTTAVRGPDGWYLPASNEASTHILKFDSERYKHLSVNEFLTTRFAAQLGLETINLSLEASGERHYLVVERYDRDTQTDRTGRVHQEDFCQAKGRLPIHKYEKEGGPGFAELAEIIRTDSSSPAEDLLRLVRWAIFCALAGNADAHAKNISLLYGARTRLAPFYDLVCTRTFPRLDKTLAMRIGGVADTSKLGTECWTRFAVSCGLGAKIVTRELSRQLGLWQEAFDAAADELRESVDCPDVIATVRREVGKRARELR